jgi:hypothetical protein
VLVPLGLLPVLACALLAYALRPAGPVVAPIRLAVVRAAVTLAAAAVVAVEGLSAVRGLTAPAVVATWVVLLGLALLAAWRRYRRDGAPARPDLTGWREQRVLTLTLAGLLLAELVLAIASPPNNWDSQTYHLPKIEHWVRGHDVDFYATVIDRQVGLAPGAEYLLLHLRLLTGGELLYNLLQWSAGLGCALVASRIAAQLGGGRTAQLVTAFLVGTTPMVVLESTSTQTDLVVAAWVGCVVTLVLDELGRRTTVLAAALIGAATGLVVLTKATGLLAAGPVLLLWLVAQLRRAPLRTPATAALVGVLALVLAGPYLYRTARTYHSPLGPPHQQELIAMQRHDPVSVFVNVLRLGYTALETPYQPLDRAAADRILVVSRGLGVDPSDPEITFFNATFPTVAWPPDEDRASLPVQGALVLVGAAVMLLRRRATGLVRGYAGVFWVAVLLHVATVKWQPWGNRLLLYLLVLGAPLAGLWLSVLSGAVGWRRVGAWAATVALVAGGCAGWLSVGYGWPRRLVGPGSTFSESRLAQRFNRRPQWAGDYVWAADAVRAAGAHRVGLVQDGDTWEYPWWVLLPGTDIEALQSTVPGHPPPVPAARFDALLCVAGAPTCAAYTLPGWRWQVHGIVRVAVRPGTGHA